MACRYRPRSPVPPHSTPYFSDLHCPMDFHSTQPFRCAQFYCCVLMQERKCSRRGIWMHGCRLQKTERLKTEYLGRGWGRIVVAGAPSITSSSQMQRGLHENFSDLYGWPFRAWVRRRATCGHMYFPVSSSSSNKCCWRQRFRCGSGRQRCHVNYTTKQHGQNQTRVHSK